MRVGVGLWCLQSSALRPRPFPALYSELLEDARHAEAVGLDSLWLSEHHFFYDGYCPALLPAAAAALSVTQRLRIGTGVLLLPLQAADRVARAAAHLAESSGGRFDLGVGAGTEAAGELFADLQANRGLVVGERLDVGVEGDEIHAIELVRDHRVHCVAACSADANDADAGCLLILIERFHGGAPGRWVEFEPAGGGSKFLATDL